MNLDTIHNLTVATYNVHSSVGRDRVCDPDRIVAVLTEINADIVALQEVGHRHLHHSKADQFTYFQERTGMHGVAGLNLLFERRPFGNALLSRWPILSVRRVDLSIHGREPRGAVDVELDVEGYKLRVIGTHLGLGPGERRRQIERIAHILDDGPEIPTIVMGDFNIFGRSRNLLRRIGAPTASKDCPASFPARMPLLGLDRIWTRPEALLLGVHAHRSPLAAIASDHLPVVGRVGLRHTHVAETAEPSEAEAAADDPPRRIAR